MSYFELISAVLHRSDVSCSVQLDCIGTKHVEIELPQYAHANFRRIKF